MSTLSTHVLDTALGKPAAGIRVTVEGADGTVIGSCTTSSDGRVSDATDGSPLPAGDYRLRFAVDEYFVKTNRPVFYPEVAILFRVGTANEHYHVPLLLSPYGYSTYRGS